MTMQISQLSVPIPFPKSIFSKSTIRPRLDMKAYQEASKEKKGRESKGKQRRKEDIV